MSSYKRLFTSESVTEGHPDKVCDQISDAIYDEMLRQDPESRSAVECFATTGLVMVGGEVRTTGYVNIQEVVRRTIRRIGYDKSEYGFCADDVGVLSTIHEQSPDIAQGVDASGDKEQGAGDQGLMFGYACDETPEYMPLPIALAHQLTKRLADVRKDRTLPYLRPDGKSQVTVEYANDRPQRVDTVVIAAQHAEAVSTSQLRKEITELVIRPVLGDLYSDQIRLHINATGRFVLGGPPADTGLTGRKIIVDTYGGVGAHGGGAFSGKDVSKVDRSASYAARYIAKNLVAAGIARRVEIQLAYAIGVAEPVSIMVNTFGTGTLENGDVIRLVQEHFPLKPADIISVLNLKRPIYEQTAAYGHFGRVDVSLPWEQLDRVDALKR